MFPLARFNQPTNPDAHRLLKFITANANYDLLDFLSVGGVVYEDTPDDFNPSDAVISLFARYGWKVAYDTGAWFVGFDHRVVPATRCAVSDDLAAAKRRLKAVTTDLLARVRKDFFKQFHNSGGNHGIFYDPPAGNLDFGVVYVKGIYPAARVDRGDGGLIVYLV